jgi:fatty-acyl-CoA synthase
VAMSAIEEVEVQRVAAPTTDISGWIAHRSAWEPEKVALRFEGREVVNRELEHRVGLIAGGLADKLGVAAGDRVAYLGNNAPELIELLFACARLGAIFVPLNSRMTVDEHQVFLADCEPRCFVVETGFREHAEQCVAVSDSRRVPLTMFGNGAEAMPRADCLEDLLDGARSLPGGHHVPRDTPVLMAYTSGSTGRPKGVLLTQEAILFNALNAIAAFQLTADDETLTIAPMSHVGGLNVTTTPALMAGATVTIMREFDAGQTLDAIETNRATLMLATPVPAGAISGHPAWGSTDLSSLRCLLTGSMPMSPAAMRPWFDRDVPVMQGYGLTETCPIATWVPMHEARRKAGSAGRPVLFCEMRVVDGEGRECGVGEPGEVLLRGPNVLEQYWRNQEATEEAFVDGWLRTGDLGHLDEDGYLYIDDRIKDIIIVGGSNVSPTDLESVLGECDRVAEAAVVAGPDPILGEVPVAFIVPFPGRTIGTGDVLQLFAGRLAAYKHPRRIIFLDSLPRTSLGKVNKGELRRVIRAAASD